MKPKRIAEIQGRGHQDRPFFNRASGRAFGVEAAGSTVEIDLYDEIGYWGVSAKDFHNTLKNITASRIELSINSPGGDVFDGIAMYNDLLNHPAEIVVNVTGLAASAASLIAMAGDKIVMAANSFLMIHNAWGLAVGNRNDFRDLADTLEQIDGALRDTYVARTGVEASEVGAMMDAETWLKADAAVDLGFADSTSGAVEAKAAFDLSIFNNVPSGLAMQAERPKATPTTRRDMERLLTQDAGLTRSEARVAMAALEDPAVMQDANGEKATQDAGAKEFVAELQRLRNPS